MKNFAFKIKNFSFISKGSALLKARAQLRENTDK
jgi:hypothetical protein